MSDVMHGIHTKIVRRHPHVFGNMQLKDVDGVLRNWEKLKADERAANGENGEKTKGLLDGVPLALPALIQSQEYQERSQRVGLPIMEISPAIKEIKSILDRLEKNLPSPEDSEALGRLFFLVSGLASHYKVDAEAALRTSNALLRSRINALEKQALAENVPLPELVKKLAQES